MKHRVRQRCVIVKKAVPLWPELCDPKTVKSTVKRKRF